MNVLLLSEIRNKIIPILNRYRVVKASVFGSYARGEQRQDSDIDLIVELPAGESSFQRAALYCDLKEALGIEVNLISPNANINSKIKERIVQQSVSLI